MYSFKKSLAAFVGVLVLVGLSATLLPLVGRGQGGRDNALPHRGPRQFYLTRTIHNGSQALSACAAGYHMASLWEIHDPSNLKYNTELGFTSEDSGFGPPSDGGWIRTGNHANVEDNPGFGNCQAWTSASSAHDGAFAELGAGFWSSNPTRISPWEGQADDCDESNKVWCVQD